MTRTIKPSLSMLICAADVRGGQYRAVANGADPSDIIDEMYEVAAQWAEGVSTEADDMASEIEVSVAALQSSLPQEAGKLDIMPDGYGAIAVMLTASGAAQEPLVASWLSRHRSGFTGAIWDLSALFLHAFDHVATYEVFHGADGSLTRRFAALWLRQLAQTEGLNVNRVPLEDARRAGRNAAGTLALLEEESS